MSDANDRPIGVFDSGMGGLTVMKALMARLPIERFVYLGDTARLPYGTKSPETVSRYAVQCARALALHDVKLLVVACNTASATALPALEAALAPTPVIGVVEAGAEVASRYDRIAVLATEGTVKGGAYPRAIHARHPSAIVEQVACPLFVALAEDGVTDGPIAELVVKRYLDPLLARAKPDCLLLGCTHYPVLAATIAKVAGPDIALVDSAATAATATARVLTERGLARTAASHAAPTFLATDAPERFARVGEIFLGRPIAPESVHLVDL